MRHLRAPATGLVTALATVFLGFPSSAALYAPVGGGSGGAPFVDGSYSFGLNTPADFSFDMGGLHLSARGSASASGTPYDYTEVSSVSSPRGVGSGLFQGGANLFYYFNVPSAQTLQLNVFFDGQFKVSGSNRDAQALARLFLFDTENGQFDINNRLFVGYSACGTLGEGECTGPTRTTQYLSQVATIRTNRVYGVYLQVFASINYATSSDAYAYADPYFYLSSQDAANGLALQFSPGAGNNPISSVPEPASWALWMTGFAVLGSLARRQGGRTLPHQPLSDRTLLWDARQIQA